MMTLGLSTDDEHYVDGGADEALELSGVSASHQSGNSDLVHLFDCVLFYCQTVS